MSRYALAIGIVGWILLGPGICAALCLPSSHDPAELPCHEAPAPERAPTPDSHAGMSCCDKSVFLAASTTQLVESLLGPLSLSTAAVEIELPEPEPASTPRALPSPPDLPNSPYLRVTPPRLVYQG